MHPILAPALLPLVLGSTAPKLDPALDAAVRSRIAVIEAWASDPAVVDAVRTANVSPRSLDEIAKIDRKWQTTSGVDAFIRGLIEHPAAERLRRLRKSHPELQEAFVTDALGANVLCTNKTSDFYQGDEKKFTEAFAGGKGAVHVGELSRDESIQAYSVPVGVPVLDDGKAIGVLVVTVNVEKLKESRAP